MDKPNLITQAELKTLLNFNQETGVFTWKNPPGLRMKSGDVAGCLNAYGKWQIKIRGIIYPASKLIGLHVNGEWPAPRAGVKPRRRHRDSAAISAELADVRSTLVPDATFPMLNRGQRYVALAQQRKVDDLESELACQIAREAAYREFKAGVEVLRLDYQRELVRIENSRKQSRKDAREFAKATIELAETP